jgi:uncharacterized membrane protein YqhA
MSAGAQDAPPGEPAWNGDPPDHPGFFEHLLKIRYIAAVVVLLAILHSLMFLVIGAHSALVTYWHIVRGDSREANSRPGLELLHSLDLFLISLVLLILALGVAKLFLRAPASARRSSQLPAWLNIESFSDLKYLLWESILTTLLIAALPILNSGVFETPDWTSLVLPATILLLALSLFFMRKT